VIDSDPIVVSTEVSEYGCSTGFRTALSSKWSSTSPAISVRLIDGSKFQTDWSRIFY